MASADLPSAPFMPSCSLINEQRMGLWFGRRKDAACDCTECHFEAKLLRKLKVAEVRFGVRALPLIDICRMPKSELFKLAFILQCLVCYHT